MKMKKKFLLFLAISLGILFIGSSPIPSVNPVVDYALKQGLSKRIAFRFSYLGEDGLNDKERIFIDEMVRINRINPKFAEWAFTDNPFLYHWVKDVELDPDEITILINAARLNELGEYVLRMPEVYLKELSAKETVKYIHSIRKVMKKDKDAARFLLESGFFINGIKIENLRKEFNDLGRKFIDESLIKSDLLRLYVSKFVQNGIQATAYRSIEVDGNPEDWQGIKPIAIDKKGDNKVNVPGTDIKSLYVARDDKKLYVMVETYGETNQRSGCSFWIMNPVEASEILQVTLHRDESMKSYIYTEGKRKECFINAKGKRDKVVEIGIPLKSLSFTQEIRVEADIFYEGDGDADNIEITVSPLTNDFHILKNFNPPKSGALGYLSDDLKSLPEISDGINDVEKKAIEQLKEIVKESNNNYQIRKGIYLIDEYGIPNQSIFNFKVPTYNTQLQALFWLLEQRNIPKEYYTIALAIGLDYGSVITISDDEVKNMIKNYIPEIFDFIVDTDKDIKNFGVNWQAKYYPLEAAISLVWWAGTTWPTEGKDYYQASWLWVLNNKLKRPMNKKDFEWLFTEVETMKDMKKWMIDNGFVDLTSTLEPFKEHLEYTKSYPFCYKEWSGKILNYLDDFFYTEGERKFVFGLITGGDSIEIDGKTIYWATIHNADWLWKDFKKTGKVRFGSCLTHSFLDSMLARSVNIGGVQILSLGHALPGYYSLRDHVWKTPVYELRAYMGHKRADGCGFYKLIWDNFHMRNIYVHDCSYNIILVHNVRKFNSIGMPIGYLFKENQNGKLDWSTNEY